MTTYNISEDLKKCKQISISFQNGRDCTIIKNGDGSYYMELDNPCDRYEHTSIGEIMRILPCSGITHYDVVVPHEKPVEPIYPTVERKNFARSLFPRFCHPACQWVEVSTPSKALFAGKLQDGKWHMEGRTCTIVEVVHATQDILVRRENVTFSTNKDEPRLFDVNA